MNSILIIDDSNESRARLSKALNEISEESGESKLIIRDVGNLQAAKNSIESARPDVVILDYILDPKSATQMASKEFCWWLRRFDPRVELILTSSLQPEEANINALDFGAQDYQDNDAEKLFHAIRRALNRRISYLTSLSELGVGIWVNGAVARNSAFERYLAECPRIKEMTHAEWEAGISYKIENVKYHAYELTSFLVIRRVQPVTANFQISEEGKRNIASIKTKLNIDENSAIILYCLSNGLTAKSTSAVCGVNPGNVEDKIKDIRKKFGKNERLDSRELVSLCQIVMSLEEVP